MSSSPLLSIHCARGRMEYFFPWQKHQLVGQCGKAASSSQIVLGGVVPGWPDLHPAIPCVKSNGGETVSLVSNPLNELLGFWTSISPSLFRRWKHSTLCAASLPILTCPSIWIRPGAVGMMKLLALMELHISCPQGLLKLRSMHHIGADLNLNVFPEGTQPRLFLIFCWRLSINWILLGRVNNCLLDCSSVICSWRS